MGILDRARSTMDLDHSYFNMLVYGPPGTGKTFLARTAAEAGHRVLLLDADHGTMTLRDQDVPSIPITCYEDTIEVYKELAEREHAYDTIFIDNLSEIQKMLVDQLKHQHGRRFGLHSWAMIVDKTSALCRLYRALSMNIVFLAHSMEVTDEDRVRIRPALSGKKLPHEIGGLFDLVGYSHTATDRTGGVAYRIGFATIGDRHITKDRSGRLEAVEPNDFGVLYRKVFPTASLVREGKLPMVHSRPLANPDPQPAPPGSTPATPASTPAPPASTPAPPASTSVTPASMPATDAIHEAKPPTSYEARPPAIHEARPHASHEARPPASTPRTHAPGPPTPASPELPAAALEGRLQASPVDDPPAHPVAHPAAQGETPRAEATPDTFGTPAWLDASQRFREVLDKIARGDKARAEAVVGYVKRTQRVPSSAQMSAREIRAWCERLEFMHTAGDLEDYL